MAERKEELKHPLMKVKEESEKLGLKLNTERGAGAKWRYIILPGGLAKRSVRAGQGDLAILPYMSR